MTINEKVKQLREEQKMSLEKLAAFSCVQRARIRAFENKNCNMTLKTLNKILYVLKSKLMIEKDGTI